MPKQIELHDQFYSFLKDNDYAMTEFIEEHYDETMLKEIMQEQFEKKDNALIVAMKEFQLEYHSEFKEWLEQNGHIDIEREDRDDE
jgi:phosphoribosylformylglycinamidine (FGAM) synthase-like enzyme